MRTLINIGKYSLILVIIGVLVITVMRLFGPKIGNTFSTISQCLGCTVTTAPESTAGLTVQEQLSQIDQALSNTMEASIAYNAPPTMDLEDTVTIELLLNPSESQERLGEQITVTGVPVTAMVEITPRMKAELLTQDKDALTIQPIHASSEQIISGKETTKWSWYVTAKKGGVQELTIVIYRLVKYDDQEYWREVEAYRANIDVRITFAQRIHAFDWKWLAGIVITLIGIPALWRYLDNRKKKGKKSTK
jgi:hypothetical protein